DQPPQDGGDQPPQDGGEQPPQDGGEQPPQDGGQQPAQDGGQQPAQDGGQQPPQNGGQQPAQDRRVNQLNPTQEGLHNPTSPNQQVGDRGPASPASQVGEPGLQNSRGGEPTLQQSPDRQTQGAEPSQDQPDTRQTDQPQDTQESGEPRQNTANGSNRLARSESLQVARNNIDTQLDAGNLDQATLSIDNLFMEQLSLYTGEEFKVDDDIQSIAQFQERLAEIEELTGKTTVVTYVLSRPDQLDFILITPRGQAIYKSVPNIQRSEVLETIQNFRGELTNPRKRNSTSYLPYAQQLYQWLIAPIEDQLEEAGTDVLVFSMDVGLRSIPVAALHDGEQFLIEKYNLGLIPSVLLTDTKYQSLENAEVLAFGASEFSEQAPLPAVPVEIETITNNLWRGKGFLNNDFTRNNLVSQREFAPSAIIHLATHAEFNSGSPQNSYIQLWNEQLTLDNLRTLGWNNPQVELLVLSACRTAVGDPSAELGFAGLAVQAGVKSALASLWYVSDEGTLALMTQFYDYLRNAQLKSDALREAQLAMLRGEVRIEGGQLRASRGNVALPPVLAGNVAERPLAHPYYWSGFTMIGSPW
ncbi:CHAT domain-containing protein, partial [Roseofilum capinflatum]